MTTPQRLKQLKNNQVTGVDVVDGKLTFKRYDGSKLEAPDSGTTAGVGDELVASFSAFSLSGGFSNDELPFAVDSNVGDSFDLDLAHNRRLVANVDLIAVLEFSMQWPAAGTAGKTRFASLIFESGEEIFNSTVKPSDDGAFQLISVTRKIAAGDKILFGAVQGEADAQNVSGSLRALRIG